MIPYNMRYRGPLEYDKFVLNSFQLHNEVYGIYMREFEMAEESNITSLVESINQIYNDIVGKETLDSTTTIIGQSDRFYNLLLNYKE